MPTRPWESLPSSPKRCLGVEGGGGVQGTGACPSCQPRCRAVGAGRGAGPCPYSQLLCSFRTALSRIWRSWCAPATGRMGPCPSYRYVGAGAAASWRDLGELIPALSLQKSIRPQVVTTFELPGCYDMWTVIAPARKEQVGRPLAGLEGPSGAGDPGLPSTWTQPERAGGLGAVGPRTGLCWAALAR